MNVEVDRALCQNYGQCVFTTPEVFELDDDDVLVYRADVDDELADKVQSAIYACPVQAITMQIGSAVAQ